MKVTGSLMFWYKGRLVDGDTLKLWFGMSGYFNCHAED
jgi:hypothetical protein